MNDRDRDEIIMSLTEIADQPTEDGIVDGVNQQTIKGALELLKKHGHWIVLKNCLNAGVYCSECKIKAFDHYPMKKRLSCFCPHCGAKMEGEEVL